MKQLKKILDEIINIPVEIGDIIKTGKFLNKTVIVKNIGKDEHGSPTINGKSILRIRIPKLMMTKENLKEYVYVCKGKDVELFKKEIANKVDGKLKDNEFRFTASEDEGTFNKYKKIADKYNCKLTMENKSLVKLEKLIENTIRKVLKEQQKEVPNLSLEELKKKFPEVIFTLNPLPKYGNNAYFARVDIMTQGGEKKYLGAIKGPIDKKQGLEFLYKTALHNYDSYY